ncbi:hypothetical protein NECAME_11461 [Necator americanus]|uniref:Uncharacterized protein n=1 Tax=Necator americanus TaxID=51031 RepID=W2T6K5_NECAM|nr:hypothetical protein NECAME_11461 [Necator americanus]ETN76771.1 hypothetical protein NECAME_11461 [Necator americanus]
MPQPLPAPSPQSQLQSFLLAQYPRSRTNGTRFGGGSPEASSCSSLDRYTDVAELSCYHGKHWVTKLGGEPSSPKKVTPESRARATPVKDLSDSSQYLEFRTDLEQASLYSSSGYSLDI